MIGRMWACEAYGDEGESFGALCFVAAAGERSCASLAECREVIAAERQRVFQRINELAANGDPDAAYLADEFPDPGKLLGG
jgi:hypothetical protein